MFLCCVCDEQRKVVGSSPIDGMCSNCGGAVSEVRVRDMFRFCFIPVCWSHHRRVMCARCGAEYKRH